VSFTATDIEELTRLLEEQPEWRARIRRLLLSGEPPQTKDPVAQRDATERRLDRFAAALERSGQEFDRRFAESAARMDRYAEERAEAERRLDQRFAELAEERAEAERRTDQRFAESAARMDRYAEERAEAERRLDQRLEENDRKRVESQDRIDRQIAEIGKRVDELTAITRSHDNDIGTLKGWTLEDRFRERPSAYLRSFFRRARAYTDRELDQLLDSGLESGVITEDDWEEVRLADVVVRGRRRDDGTEVFLVVEVSWGVGLYDLERAVRRAGILGRLVAPVLPVVAGNGVTAEARSRCDEDGVWLVLDGHLVAPEGTDTASD